jgi:flavin-dependent dehydrogenase
MPEQYDVVIVGAGMAGGVLASRIAEQGVNPKTRARLRVALMEMGPYFKGDPRPGYGIPLRRQAYSNLAYPVGCQSDNAVITFREWIPVAFRRPFLNFSGFFPMTRPVRDIWSICDGQTVSPVQSVGISASPIGSPSAHLSS